MTPEESDLKRIKELIQVMEEHDLVELQIEHGDDRVCLKRTQPHASGVTVFPLPAPQPGLAGRPEGGGPGPQAASQDKGLAEIKAPLVGTFYQAASPDSDAYVEVDSHVEPQTVVCIIEAMKVMNEIKAEISGTIVAVLATNGQAVQYSQPLFKVRPD